MKVFLLSILLILISGCVSPGVFPEREDINPHYDIEKVSGTVYVIDYYGSPLSSIEETRKQWNHKASAICGDDYKYKNLKTAEICGTANLNCIDAHDLINDSGKKIQPFATGIALCVESDEPKVIYSSFLSNEKSDEVQPVIVVKELQDGAYFVEYAGTPENTIEEGRKAWHERASITCNGQSYDTKISKNSMWQEDINASGEGISLKYNHSSSLSSELMHDLYCVHGGAFECLVAGLTHSFMNNRKKKPEFEVKEDEKITYEEEVRFPVVEGRVFCK